MKRLVGRIGCPELKQMLIFNWISNVLVLENLVLRCLGFELFGQQHHALAPFAVWAAHVWMKRVHLWFALLWIHPYFFHLVGWVLGNFYDATLNDETHKGEISNFILADSNVSGWLRTTWITWCLEAWFFYPFIFKRIWLDMFCFACAFQVFLTVPASVFTNDWFV